ncbi:GntR family transcriptional regulator [Niallia oryzisoli]|uniref:GntR family transcriptional regulator n=1 Tax=Niallia oryzisoli TaxID=1737571 RepID=A0ABZ2CFW3_9BACI
MMKLDPHNPIPLHVQLKTILERQINQGYFQDKIPSERELTEQYEVSRTTVREAVSQLVQDGILEKRHGKGTFVSVRPIHEWLGSLSSTTETVKKMGMTPGAELLSHGIVDSPPHLESYIPDKQMYLIKRLRYANDEPLSIETHYYPVDIGEKMARYDIATRPLYEILETELHIQLWEGEQMITGRTLTSEEAELLGVKENHHALLAERYITDIEGTLIEHSTSLYRADLYSFHMKLLRK